MYESAKKKKEKRLYLKHGNRISNQFIKLHFTHTGIAHYPKFLKKNLRYLTPTLHKPYFAAVSKIYQVKANYEVFCCIYSYHFEYCINDFLLLPLIENEEYELYFIIKKNPVKINKNILFYLIYQNMTFSNKLCEFLSSTFICKNYISLIGFNSIFQNLD